MLTIDRPWGHYTLLQNETTFKTKKVVVHPGKEISPQSHMHRNEHWIIVSSTAEVTVEGTTRQLHKNESTYIPACTKHQLKNPGVIDLVLLEAQVGEYLEEDDTLIYDEVNVAAS